MNNPADILDRGIPDLIDSTDLPVVLAAEVDHLAGRTARWETDARTHPAVRARALTAGGRIEAAREALAECSASEFSPQALAAASWTVSRIGGSDLLDRLEIALAKCPEGFIFEGEVPVANTAMLAGQLAVARGQLQAALDELDAAVSMGDRRAPAWGAVARLELARVLMTSAHLSGDGTDRREQAERTLGSARAFFLAGAYRHLADVAKELEQPPAAAVGTEPLLGHLVAGHAIASGAHDRSPGDVSAPTWHAGFGVQPTVRVRDRKGLHALAYLIANRDRRVPVIELEAVIEGRMAADITPVDEQLLRSDTLLEDADLTEAIRDLLLDDRARTRVSKLLRRTISSLGDEHPVLAAHLDVAVRTGYACRYEAAPEVRWRMRGPAGSAQL